MGFEPYEETLRYDSLSMDLPEPFAFEPIVSPLNSCEAGWRDRQLDLESHGYMLRPRYSPTWVPSSRAQRLGGEFSEDAIESKRRNTMNATRMHNGQLVCVKRVREDGPELRFTQTFSEDPQYSDPRNHCVPVLDCFPSGDFEERGISHMIMPFLRHLDDPPFTHVNDVIELVDQLLEGLEFLHSHNVAHRNCASRNVMMDAHTMFPDGFHPVRTMHTRDALRKAVYLPRLLANVRYYFVDLNLAVYLPPDILPRRTLIPACKDPDIPECKCALQYDPFKGDVFMIGNIFRKHLYSQFSNIQFIRPLIISMTEEDATARISAAEALQQWRRIRWWIWWPQRLFPLHRRLNGVFRNLFFDVVLTVRLVYSLLRYALPKFFK